MHDPPSRSNSLIMEYVNNTEWKELYHSFTEIEIKHYVFQLLTVRVFVSIQSSSFADSITFITCRPLTLCTPEESCTVMSSLATSCLTEPTAR